jgi:transposase
VFLDESAAKTNMTRLRGRSQRGKRLHFACPHGHWRTTTMISSMRLDGSTACMTIDGATDTEVFRAYVCEVLLPTLKAGDIVVMDNLTPHKSAETLALLEAAGVQVWFFPTYSPDLNPIEKMWSKVKQILRSLEPRTHEELLAAIATALSRITAADARNWFYSCGYIII